MSRPPEAVVEEIRISDVQKVKVAIVDLDGILRGKYIHKDKFLSAVDGGFGFCNVVFGWDCADVCYDEAKYTGWHTGYPDAVARIDINSFRRIPWDDDVPFFLGDFWTDQGDPLGICPRQLLKRVVAKAHSMGFDPVFGLEFEWFNFSESADSLHQKGFNNPTPLTPGMFGYSVLRSSQNRGYFNDLIDQLRLFNVPVEGIHTETGPGVYEAAILYGPALEAADRGVLFKAGVKEIASDHGIVPTFMARWNNELPGSSGHLHQSLKSLSDGENTFYDPSTKKMSKTFESYVAGQLNLLPEILVMLAPNINSYKRLVEGFWAPTTATWGIDNRTAALRVIPGNQKSMRLETRVSGADINPYLAIAANLAAGLYGIEHQLNLEQAPIQGNAYEAKDATRLPGDLPSATEAFASSERTRALFGDEFVDHFAVSRRWEWKQSQQAITDWERQRYFEII